MMAKGKGKLHLTDRLGQHSFICDETRHARTLDTAHSSRSPAPTCMPLQCSEGGPSMATVIAEALPPRIAGNSSEPACSKHVGSKASGSASQLAGTNPKRRVSKPLLSASSSKKELTAGLKVVSDEEELEDEEQLEEEEQMEEENNLVGNF